MRPILFAAPVLLAIAGCQATRNAEIANSVTAGRADCAGRQFSTMVAWAECANAAELPCAGLPWRRTCSTSGPPPDSPCREG